MKALVQYNSLDEVLVYFNTLLQEAVPESINSVIKYAKVNDEEIKLHATKRKGVFGNTWNFEITVK
jgi:hypothetical protein